MSEKLENSTSIDFTDVYTMDFLDSVKDLLLDKNTPEDLKHFLLELVESHQDLLF